MSEFPRTSMLIQRPGGISSFPLDSPSLSPSFSRESPQTTTTWMECARFPQTRPCPRPHIVRVLRCLPRFVSPCSPVPRPLLRPWLTVSSSLSSIVHTPCLSSSLSSCLRGYPCSLQHPVVRRSPDFPNWEGASLRSPCSTQPTPLPDLRGSRTSPFPSSASTPSRVVLARPRDYLASTLSSYHGHQAIHRHYDASCC